VPTSDKQLAANRANEGKARSCQNARTHSFTASTFAVVRLEDLNEIANLRTDLIAFYQPVNSQELFALESMAIAQQETRRVARLGSGIFTVCLDMSLNHDGTAITPMTPDLVGDGDIEITRAQNRNYAFADGFHRLAKKDNTFPLFLRYKTQNERLYRRTVEELERLKPLRPESPKEAILEVQPEEKEPLPTPPDQPISTPQSNPEPPLESVAQPTPAVPGGPVVSEISSDQLTPRSSSLAAFLCFNVVVRLWRRVRKTQNGLFKRPQPLRNRQTGLRKHCRPAKANPEKRPFQWWESALPPAGWRRLPSCCSICLPVRAWPLC
jgi:hypothetical protein